MQKTGIESKLLSYKSVFGEVMHFASLAYV